MPQQTPRLTDRLTIDAYVDAHLADFGPEPVTLGPAGPGAPLLHLAWTRTF